MTCFNPFPANIVQKEHGLRYNKFYGFVPCGSCLACKIQKSSEWAMRLTHEYSVRKKGVFLTLTYDDEHLPENKHLVKKDLQKFFKRLRQYLVRRVRDELLDKPAYSCMSVEDITKEASKILSGQMKYFACGEYGDKEKRPHYHVILLGFSKHDKYFVKAVKSSWKLCNWKVLEFDKVFGTVNYDSCRYVADYSFSKKSMNELIKDGYYEEYDSYDEFGNAVKLHRMIKQPPFQLVSHGIGESFVNKYSSELKANESVRVHGAERSLPKYYRDKLGLPKRVTPFLYDKGKEQIYETFISSHQREFEEFKKKKEHIYNSDVNSQIADYFLKQAFYNIHLFKTRSQTERNSHSKRAIHKNRQKL